MITLSNINKTFNKNSPNEVRLMDDFNFEIKQGDFIVVVGSNGSGKTTLLNLIAGSVRQDGGSIQLDGKNISSLRDYQRSRWIARIFQNPLAGTAPDLTILENFRLAALRTKGKMLGIGTNEKFKGLVKEKVSILRLGLENKLDQFMGNLSGGQRQSLALLMAIMDETKLLLLDEPAAALDPKTSQLVMKLVQRVVIDYNLTTLLVTHQLKDVIDFGNRIVQLKEGKIIRDLRPQNLEPLKLTEVFDWFN